MRKQTGKTGRYGEKGQFGLQEAQNRIHAETAVLVSRLQGILHESEQCIAESLPRVLHIEVHEPVMYVVELCICVHFRARPSLSPRRQTPVAQLRVSSAPAVRQQLLAYFLPVEGPRKRSPHEPRAEGVRAYCRALRTPLG